MTPEKGINEASFIIRVKDPSLLDFETLKVVNFELVAREMTETDAKESRVPVTVHVRDRNDNQVSRNLNNSAYKFTKIDLQSKLKSHFTKLVSRLSQKDLQTQKLFQKNK